MNISSSSSKEKKDKKDKSTSKIKNPLKSSSPKIQKSSPKVREISGGQTSQERKEPKDSSDFKRSEEGRKKSTPDKSSSSMRYLEKTKRIAKKGEIARKKRN